jgi:hypothetical protein
VLGPDPPSRHQTGDQFLALGLPEGAYIGLHTKRIGFPPAEAR